MKAVLIVDDHPGFRASARRMLEADGFEVVARGRRRELGRRRAAASCGRSSCSSTSTCPTSRASTWPSAFANGAAPAVVLTSSRDASDFGPLVERSGARGFIPKSELSGEALAALLR